jgi:hypothetical protein
MNKLCVVSYYGPIDTIGLAEKMLENSNTTIFDFPLFKYMHDTYEKIDNYVDVFIKFIQDNDINIVLWWFINIPTSQFAYIKEISNVKYLFFNWDDPYNWPHCDIINKMPYMDAAFVTCYESLATYLENGCKIAECLYPGYDPKNYFMITEINTEIINRYSCDISICCTNLYDDDNLYPNQYIKRKQLLIDIYNGQFTHNYKFYIYGPESFRELFPLSYRGFAKYDDHNYIFNYSKINLCTHVINNKKGYLNERVILIGGSGGLLLMDNINGINEIFDINKEILILDKHYYVEQIASIIDNYEKYIDIRKNLNIKCMKNYTYECWAKSILSSINNL